jgi:hypothetical protein
VQRQPLDDRPGVADDQRPLDRGDGHRDPLSDQRSADVVPRVLHGDGPGGRNRAQVAPPVDQAEPGIGIDLRRHRRARRHVREGHPGRPVPAAAGLVGALLVVMPPERRGDLARLPERGRVVDPQALPLVGSMVSLDEGV